MAPAGRGSRARNAVAPARPRRRPARPDRAPRSNRDRAHCPAPARRRSTVPDISIGSHAMKSRGPAGSKAAPSAMMPAPTKPPVNPARIFLDIFASIIGLSVDEDRGVHRGNEGDHGDDGGGQRRPPRIGRVPPHHNEHQHGERDRHQRDPEVAGHAAELVDHGQQQRRQETGQRCRRPRPSGRSLRDASRRSDRLGQRSPPCCGAPCSSTVTAAHEVDAPRATRPTN